MTLARPMDPVRLYHCFPRPSVCTGDPESEAIREELAISALTALGLFVDFGLVLTPERLEIPANPDSPRNSPSSEGFTQVRACFTLLERPALFIKRRLGGGSWAGKEGSHTDVFGDFALGLDPIEARDLGVLAVTYFYRPVVAQGDTERLSVGQEVLFRLRELHILLRAIAHLEAVAEPPDRSLVARELLDGYGFHLRDEDSVSRKLDSLDRPTALGAYRLLDTDRVPAWNLADWLTILLNSYQVADSRDDDESLQYYQQREWRVVRMVGSPAQCFPLGGRHQPEASEIPGFDTLIDGLKACNPNFFSDRRLADCWLLRGTRWRGFFDYVREIIAPAWAADEVRSLLVERGLESQFSGAHTISGSKGEHIVFERNV